MANTHIKTVAIFTDMNVPFPEALLQQMYNYCTQNNLQMATVFLNNSWLPRMPEFDPTPMIEFLHNSGIHALVVYSELDPTVEEIKALLSPEIEIISVNLPSERDLRLNNAFKKAVEFAMKDFCI